MELGQTGGERSQQDTAEDESSSEPLAVLEFEFEFVCWPDSPVCVAIVVEAKRSCCSGLHMGSNRCTSTEAYRTPRMKHADATKVLAALALLSKDCLPMICVHFTSVQFCSVLFYHRKLPVATLAKQFPLFGLLRPSLSGIVFVHATREVIENRKKLVTGGVCTSGTQKVENDGWNSR